MNEIDTNSVAQAFEKAAFVKSQVQANWPMICAVAVIVARELRNFNAWVRSLAEFVIAHGGILMITKRLFWNPSPSDRLATPVPHEDALSRVNAELEKGKQS